MKTYWERDGIKLFLGDSVELMADFDRKSMDCTITDPPFEDEAHTLQRRIKRPEFGETERVEKIEALEFVALDERTRERAGLGIARLTRRWALVFCQIEASTMWARALEPLVYKRTCLWIKPNGMPQLTGDRPGMGYETFVACHRKGRSTWNGGGRTGVFIHNKPQAATGHQTIKPLPLMADLVRLFTDPGEIVFDPFAGSGSTLVAAWRQHRRAIGIELSEKYAEGIAKRLEYEMSQTRLQLTSPPSQMAFHKGEPDGQQNDEGEEDNEEDKAKGGSEASLS